MAVLGSKKVNSLINSGYDLNFLSRVQSSNPNFKENDAYVKKGDGYQTAISIANDGYPTSGLGRYWLESVMLMNSVNSFLAIGPADHHALNKQSKKAISNMGTTKSKDSSEDEDNYSKALSLDEFRQSLANNIPAKKIYCDLIVSGDSEVNLRENLREIRNKAPQFVFQTSDGFQEELYGLAFIPASKRELTRLGRKAQPISVVDLGASYHFIHTSLMDEFGTYLGMTFTKGAVHLDIFKEDERRTTPTLLIAGREGTNKEQLNAKLLDSYFAKGHFLYNLDFEGKYSDLTETQGGLVMKMYGNNNNHHLNFMEVMGTRQLEDGITTDQVESFKEHREKLKAFAQVIDPKLEESDLNNLSSCISDLYIDRGLWSYDAESKPNSELHITDVVHEDYPLPSDLVESLYSHYLDYQVRSGNDSLEAKSYMKLYNAFSTLVENNQFLNNHSNFDDISNEIVVNFDFSGITNKTIRTIQQIQVLDLITTQAAKNAKKSHEIYNDERNTLKKEQLPHTVISFFGADVIFARDNDKAIEYIVTAVKSISSNFGAVIMELASLESILSATNSTESDAYTLATRALFSAFRYRVFSQTDAITIPKLANTLQGELTESELQSLKMLGKGQFFLNIANGGKNILFTNQLSNEHDVSVWNIPYSEQDRYRKLK